MLQATETLLCSIKLAASLFRGNQVVGFAKMELWIAPAPEVGPQLHCGHSEIAVTFIHQHLYLWDGTLLGSWQSLHPPPKPLRSKCDPGHTQYWPHHPEASAHGLLRT
jgi:hypothetical protein